MSDQTGQSQHEIVSPSPLLNSEGSLVQAGWARRPLLDANLENVHTTRLGWMQRFRIKRWDYYGVTTPRGYFSVTLADLGYGGLAFVYYVDLSKGSYHEETVIVPLGRGIDLPRNSNKGDANYSNRKVQLSFRRTEEGRHVEVRWHNFGGVPLFADLSFSLPSDHESTVLVVPIEGNRFYYNRKINTMPVTGSLQIGADVMIMDPDTCFGNLDWGRGVWEYDSFWVWASASGLAADGRRIGLNMGHGFGDTSAATENTLLLDGRIHKLGRVAIDYAPETFMMPWRFSADRVDLEFVPFLERVAKTNVVVIRSEVHQIFGRYSGTILSDTGDTVLIDGLIGWAEEHHARW